MAETLIERFTSSFDHEQYEDEYRRRLLKIVKRKQKGEEIHAEAPGGARGADGHARSAARERRGGEERPRTQRTEERTGQEDDAQTHARPRRAGADRDFSRPRAPRGLPSETNSSADAWVASSTTGGATPASSASCQRAATTHQRSPGLRPGNIHCGCGVTRSLPACDRELQELLRHDRADGVEARVDACRLAATRPGRSRSAGRTNKARARRRGRSRR